MLPANVEKIKTHILHLVTFFFFFSENRAVCEINVEKCGTARLQRWQYKTAHAYCMPDTYGYRHTLTICNTSCFSTATMVPRTRLNVTLYVHCLSSLPFGKKTRRQSLSGMNVSKHSHNAICSTYQWRTEGGFGVFKIPPQKNSEGPPKSCQSQPDCENC